MQDSYFQHLRVDTLPEDFIEEYSNWFSNLNEDFLYFLPPGTHSRVVRHCLQKAEPFKSNKSDKILVHSIQKYRKRLDIPKYRKCLDIPKLLTEVTDILLEYEGKISNLHRGSLKYMYFDRRPKQEAFDTVKESVSLYYRLNKGKKMTNRNRLKHYRKTIFHVLDTIEMLVNTVSESESRAQIEEYFSTSMEDAVETLDWETQTIFGRYVQRIGKGEKEMASASILSLFDIQKGEISDIAGRRRKNRSRLALKET